MLGDEYSLEDQFRLCRDEYAGQKQLTIRAAQQANRELERLLSHVQLPEQFVSSMKSGTNDMTDIPEGKENMPEVKKLLFINTQVHVAKSILDNLLAQDVAWDSTDFLGEPDDDTKRKRIGHYQAAAHIMVSIEVSFRHAVGIDTNLFSVVWTAYKESMATLSEHPLIVGGAVGGAAVLGALVGGGVVTLHVGFKAMLISIFGKATFLEGALVGGVAGLILAGIVVGVIHMYQQCNRSHEEKEAAELSAAKERIAKICQQDVQFSRADLDSLQELFEKAFQRPVMISQEHECAFCLEHFPADGGDNRSKPVKAPRCRGHHMLHAHCLEQWVRSSHDDRCIVCRC